MVKKTNQPEKVTEIPAFTDGTGGNKLRKLKRKDFPKTRAGKMSFCEYMAAKWLSRKKVIAEKGDPKTKLQKKKEDLTAKLKMINDALEGLK